MKFPEAWSPHRILVLQLRQIGDVLLTSPALAALHRRFPDAHITLVTEAQCAQLMRGNPDLHEIVELNKKSFTGITSEFCWYWHTARGGYDLVIDFQQLPRCRFITLFSRAPYRFAANPRWYSRLLYNVLAPVHDGEYAAWDKVDALAPLGIVNQHEPPRVYLFEEEKKAAQVLLASLGRMPGQRIVTLDTTHRRQTRRWPSKYYAALVGLLHAADSTLRFMPFWGPGEEEDIRELCAAVPESARESMLLAPKMLSLREMAACIGEASLHIGNCSAPQHIAVAVGTPSCIIRGSTGDEWRYPSSEHVSIKSGLPCQPCQQDTCQHCKCLTELKPEKVAEAALGLLERTVR